MEKDKSVGIWIRVSTEDQVKGESPEHHERRARAYAESKGWSVKKIYRLEAVSGKSVMDRLEAKEMLEDIRVGNITGLIFSKLARLARNTRELLEFADLFRSYNADLISLQESIDTSTPAGRLFYTMIAAMAQWEREEIASRVAASVPIRAKLGKPLGGQAPFGYQWIDKKLIPDPKEAPIRKLIYELFLEHKRKKRVAAILNERGYRTRNDSKFSDTTINRLLRDPMAKGLRRSNYTKSLGTKKHWELKAKVDWVFTEVEAIVSEELWNKCNHILDEQSAKRTPPTRKPVYLFTGLVFCSCGGKMPVPSKSKNYFCSKCKNKIAMDDLEAIFHEQLKTFIFSPDEITKYFDKANQAIKEKEELLESLSKEAKKIREEMDQIIRLYLDKNISQEAVGTHYRPLEERLKQIDEQIPTLQGEIDFLKIQYISSDEVVNDAKDLYSHWTSLGSEEKRQIVETITNKITISNEDINISLSSIPLPLNSSSLATHPQGFIAQTSIKLAGKSTDILERLIVTLPSSSGCRITSSTFRANSGSSSRNRTP